MKKHGAIAGILIGLLAAAGCSREDADRARREGHEAQEKTKRQLEVTRDKLREDLKRADQQTREDLDKARDQLHHALNQSERDVEKARDKVRDRTKDGDSHQ
jgi:molecular chaperone DnaK (HSP70)